MKFTELELMGSYLVEPEPHGDERGLLARTFCAREFGERGLETAWVQCNLTFTAARGTVRGLHWQAPPHEEAKLVRCTAGAVFDVIVDLRPGSPTRGRWQAFELSARNRRQLYIPAGFAHGLQTLEPDTEMSYQMSAYYVAAAKRGLRWNDPALAISWPLPVAMVGDADQALPTMDALKEAMP
ncbi:MAG: dTDP-4-dehydrorhamnose 3,5-epimerase [Betaproteobacteria bacterium]